MSRISLARRSTFSIGRQLFHPEWDDERNRAAFGRSVGPHGADFWFDVVFAATDLPEDGMIVNIYDIKEPLKQLTATLDGHFLPFDVPEFEKRRPTAENIALYLWEKLPKEAGIGTLAKVTLQEGRRIRVEKLPDTMKISRSYEFAAAHRLVSLGLSDDENWALYDKCSNLAGHGHNFTLEVVVEGAPNSQTGYIVPPVLLDNIVDEEVYTRFDHKHLNVDCPEFEGLVPTSENLARVIFDILSARLEKEGFLLARIGLRETSKNYFEVER